MLSKDEYQELYDKLLEDKITKTMEVLRLRKMTLKSVINVGRFYNLSVQNVIDITARVFLGKTKNLLLYEKIL